MSSHRLRRLGRVGLAVLATASAFATAATGATTAAAVPPPPLTGGACDGPVLAVPMLAHLSEVLFRRARENGRAGIAVCVDQNHPAKTIRIQIRGVLVGAGKDSRLVLRGKDLVGAETVLKFSGGRQEFTHTVRGVRAEQRIPIEAVVYADKNSPAVISWKFFATAR